MYQAEVICHSVSPEGKELLTFEVEFPRVVLAEVVTHRLNYDCWNEFTAERTTTRDISKNSASSRAIPLHRMIAKVMTDPYVPENFSAAGPGMQAAGWLEGDDAERAKKAWLSSLDAACIHALATQNESDREACFSKLPCVAHLERFVRAHPANEKSLHKQDVNRLLEPWGWVKQVITATEWDNFFALRCHEAAAPAFRKVARMMYLAKAKSTPHRLDYGEWHLPYVPDWRHRLANGSTTSDLLDVSAARCAWTSYWPPEGGEMSPEQVTRVAAKLKESRPVHASPWESQARPMTVAERSDPSLVSNLEGWVQNRCLIAGHVTRDYRPSAEEVASWGL